MYYIAHTLFLFFLFQGFLYSQNPIVKGKIIDKDSGEPLAFVNIVYNEKNNATQSSIDGVFQIPATAKVQFIKCSYVGYETQNIPVSEIRVGKTIEIKLKKAVLDLNEVTVFPGENPAHRIIKKVIENRNKNNPEKMLSFSYTSYNKLFFTFNMDDLKNPDSTLSIEDSLNNTNKTTSANIDTLKKTKADSSYIRAKKFLNSQHLFLMESVSDRKFIHPDKNHEKVIASKVSGLKNP